MNERQTNAPREHVYYWLRFTLRSSMLIGNGQSVYTDNDLLLDARGLPCIPGSTIAGMLRDMAEGPDRPLLFGYIDGSQSRACQSSLYVYDAVCITPREKIHIVTRDNVALDEYKTAIDKKKFDYQVLKPDAEFLGLIEIEKDTAPAIKDKADTLIRRLAADGCAFGSKKTRGMGRMDVIVKRKAFDLNDPGQKEAWLSFDPFDGVPDDAERLEPLTGLQNNVMEVRLTLKLRAGLTIREYTTDLDGTDYRALGYEADQNGSSAGAAIVPGTTWAGAFRARVKELTDDSTAAALFGYVTDKRVEPAAGVKDKPDACRSQVSFSETRITGGSPKRITRNAIDRFTGSVKQSALYSEQTYWGGCGELIIRISVPDQDNEVLQRARCALGASIADLHHGYLAVGGLTSVGRGLFDIEALTIDSSSFALTDGWEDRLIRCLGKGMKESDPA